MERGYIDGQYKKNGLQVGIALQEHTASIFSTGSFHVKTLLRAN